MGAEPIKLTKYTTFAKGTELLKDFQCSDCYLFIDEKDIEEHNYQFEVSDYANEITKEITLDGQDYVYVVDFWLKFVNHNECPDSERCKECYGKFRIEQIKEFQEEYYCEPCFKNIFPQKNPSLNQ